jgi:hypothetical protein
VTADIPNISRILIKKNLKSKAFSQKFTDCSSVIHLVIDNTNASEFLTYSYKNPESRVPPIEIHICFVSEIHLETDLPTYGSLTLVYLGRFFRFLIYTQSVGLLGGGISPSQGRYLHTEQQKHNKRTQTYMPRAIRTHDPSVRASEDGSCLRPRGHCDRLSKRMLPTYADINTEELWIQSVVTEYILIRFQ